MSDSFSPADNLEELQRQLQFIESHKALADEYLETAGRLDKIALEFEAVGPAGLTNFHEVIPGIYRSANPTMDQVNELSNFRLNPKPVSKDHKPKWQSQSS